MKQMAHRNNMESVELDDAFDETSLDLGDVFEESRPNCALVKRELKVKELSNEQLDVSREDSIQSPQNKTSNAANVTLSIKKEKLQSGLVRCIERMPFVKTERYINVGKSNDHSSDGNPEDRYLIEECQNEVNCSLTRHVRTEPLIADSEEEESLSTFEKSVCNERTIKEEYFIESEIIVQEELDIKDEDEEEDQFTANKVNEREIKDDYLDVPESIALDDIFIKTEHQEEDHSNSGYEETMTKKSERKYCCDKCSYETKRKCYLVGHMRIHDKVNAPKYSCNYCPYQTIHNSYLKTHLRMHDCFGLRCILCQKSFNRKQTLDAHYITRHPDRSDKWGSTITNKINECPKCRYKTIFISNFKAHLMTHEAPSRRAQFKCNICRFKCIRKRNLTIHLRLHAGQLTFVCTECDKKFNIKQQLDGHIISRHSNNEKLISSVTSKLHQCFKCDFKTVYYTHLKNHLKLCL